VESAAIRVGLFPEAGASSSGLSQSKCRGMSSRFLTCLLRALGALLQSLRELVVTSNRPPTHPNRRHPHGDDRTCRAVASDQIKTDSPGELRSDSVLLMPARKPGKRLPADAGTTSWPGDIHGRAASHPRPHRRAGEKSIFSYPPILLLNLFGLLQRKLRPGRAAVSGRELAAV
jgi:hypothetical protein